MEEPLDQTESGLCYRVTWDRSVITAVENFNDVGYGVTKYDFILAGLKRGVIDKKFVTSEDTPQHYFNRFDLQAMWEELEVIQKETDEDDLYFEEHLELLIEEIDSIGLDQFTIIIKDGAREYEAQFYGPEDNYMYKELVTPVVQKDLENALLYTELIKYHYQRVWNNIDTSDYTVSRFLMYSEDWNLANEPGWKQLQDKVDYIYRHYKRI